MNDCIEMFYPKIFIDIAELSRYYCIYYDEIISIDRKIGKADLEMIVDKIYYHLYTNENKFGKKNLLLLDKKNSPQIEKNNEIIKIKRDFIKTILINEIIERRNLQQFVKIYSEE